MQKNKHENNRNSNPFPKMEEEVLNFWDKAKIFEKSVQKDALEGDYVFYEGPPTANGLPGIHHVLARAFKDVLPRYKTMSGYRVERKAGWDTHGLPVELQVEKELNISGKPEIEKHGIKEFNEKCKGSVWQFKDEWEKLTRRIAFWVDMENPYITYENYYVESLWQVIKRIYNKGLLYKGHKVVHHCPRCGTSLSSHEVAQGYKKVNENSVYVKFKIKDPTKLQINYEFTNKDNLYILAWTTTPWTLPGNVALAVGSNINYSIVQAANGIYILASDKIGELFTAETVKVIKELKGKDLVGLEYEPLFNIKSIQDSGKKAYYVASADFVTTEEGTGVVHTAVMYGEDDYSLGEKIDLPKVHTVDEEGKFTNDLAEYDLAGKFVKNKKTEKIIIDYLKNQGLLFAEEMYEHDYPFCWRCDTPLLYYAKDSWFIKMTAVRDDLVANNEKINWVPEHIKTGRFGEWVANVKDWAISRERYWGTPLPIWQCKKCGELKCIGSIKELGADIKDLHRPFVDEIKFKCKCGGEMIRDESVLDCWFDSGAMPFAQHHYPFENKDLIDKGKQYPADFICEAIDQTRGWFYTLLAISTLLDKGTCYKNVICLGHINDKYGKKMSKSKGNIIDPWDVINQFGVDAVRLHMYTINQPGEGKNYDLDDVRDVFRKNIMILWNVYKFYNMYANHEIAALPPPFAKSGVARNDSENILDKWIMARLNQLIEKVSNGLDKYYVYEAAREIPSFINDLSTWYLRRSRDRFKTGDEKDKQAALQTTSYVLLELSKVMAPFMPFIAEQIWQRVTGNDFKDKDKSVHLEAWSSTSKVDNKILDEMEMARKIVELGLAARDEAGIKVRQPLRKLEIRNLKLGLSKEYINLIKDEVNVKIVETHCDASGKNVETQDFASIKVELDTKLTNELEQEGIKRELVRFINNLRKNAGMTIQDKAHVYWQTDDKDIKKTIKKYKKDIMKDTLASKMDEKKSDEVDLSKEVKVNGIDVWLGIKKI